MTAGVGEQPAQLAETIRRLNRGEFTTLAQDVVGFVGAARSLLDRPGRPQADLAGAGLGFLASVLDPLQRCLHEVTGDADALTTRALEWHETGRDLRRAVPEIERLTRSARHGWSGAASRAFDATMREFAETVTGAGRACDGLTRLLRTSADLMSGAQGLILDVIDQVVDYMIVAEATGGAGSVRTYGASRAASLTAILGRVSDGVERAIDVVDHAEALLRRIAEALREVRAVFVRVGELVARLMRLGRDAAPGSSA